MNGHRCRNLFCGLSIGRIKKNAVSTLSFRLSSKESFGRRDYCCTLGDHRRAVGG
jgi:hypothetical protein